MPAAHPAADALIAFGRDQLPAAEAGALRRHLDGCEACRRRLAGSETNPAGGTDVFAGVSQVVRGLADLPTVDRVPEALTGLTQYADLKELGRGGMGVVYLTRHTLLDRPVVLKVASRALLAKAGGDAADRFLREMRSAAKLSHPNVVAAYDAFRHGDALVFVMEYAHGEDLAKVLARKGPLPVPTACFYAHGVALALQHAHDHGLVHRDIKPANLIQVKTGTKAVVKVLDFGLAKVTREAGGSGPTLTNTGMCTPQYMAPEQWKDAGGVGIRADIYSLGCTLFCLLTGRPPFHGNQFELMLAHCNRPAPPAGQLRPDVPAELSAAVAKMLAKDPAARFQTPAEVAQVLVPFIRQATKPVPAAKPAPARAQAVVGSPFRQMTLVHDSARAATAAPVAQRRWVWPAVAAGVVMAGLLAALAGGAFKAKTPHGTIVVEDLPADAEVLLDGATATVTRSGESVSLTAVPGPHALKVVRGGVELLAKDEVVVTVGGPVRARVEPATDEKTDPLRRRLADCLARHKREAAALRQAGLRLFDERAKLPGADNPIVRDELAAERRSFEWIGDLPDWVPTTHVVNATRLRQATIAALDAIRDVARAQGRWDVQQSAAAERAVVANDPAILMRWSHQVWSLAGDRMTQPEKALNLHASTGMTLTGEKYNTRDGEDPTSRWEMVSPEVLVVRWYRQPDGVSYQFVDTVTIATDGKSFGGTNNLNNMTIRGRRLPIRPVRLPGPPQAPATAGFVPLFNGRDKTGWSVVATNPDEWAVEEGVLVARGPAESSMLVSDAEFTDFHLRAEFRVNDIGNGGIFFRTPPAHDWVLRASYEVEIQYGGDDSRLDTVTGGLNGGAEVLFRPDVPAGRPGEWCTYEVLAAGSVITLKVNGKTVGVCTDPKRTSARGRIGLQKFTPRTVIEFRNVEVKAYPPRNASP